MNTVQICKNTFVQPGSPLLAFVGRMFVPWLVVAAVLFVPPDVAAQQIVRAEGDRVSIAANGVPLQKVLDRFAELVELKLWVKHDVGERDVTVELEPLPVAVALRRVLLSAGVDFVMSGDAANPPIRLVIGDSKGPEVAVVLTGAAEAPMVEPVIEPVKEPETAAASEKPEEERASQPQAIDVAGPVIPPGISPSERLVQLLMAPARAKVPVGAPIALPFLGPDGQPYTVPNYPPTPGVVQLPFPDPSTGQPLEVVVQPSKPGVFTLPFLGPDGQPYTVPAVPVRAPVRRPGASR